MTTCNCEENYVDSCNVQLSKMICFRRHRDIKKIQFHGEIAELSFITFHEAEILQGSKCFSHESVAKDGRLR